MVTDGLPSYKKAFNAEFYDHHQSCKHVADVALQESLNNVLERMHGSIREREKIMRGIKVDDTPIIPMNQIYMCYCISPFFARARLNLQTRLYMQSRLERL
jgi:transposase-like protein